MNEVRLPNYPAANPLAGPPVLLLGDGTVQEVPAEVWFLYEIQAATIRYYAQDEGLLATPEHFAAWLEGLPPRRRAVCAYSGWPAARDHASFRRYVLELHGFSLYAHFQAHLSPGAFAYWRQGGGDWQSALDPNQEAPLPIPGLPLSF